MLPHQYSSQRKASFRELFKHISVWRHCFLNYSTLDSQIKYSVSCSGSHGSYKHIWHKSCRSGITIYQWFYRYNVNTLIETSVWYRLHNLEHMRFYHDTLLHVPIQWINSCFQVFITKVALMRLNKQRFVLTEAPSIEKASHFVI